MALTIPAVTTTEIPVWEHTITSFDNESASSTSDVFYVTSSILPPPFVITATLPHEAEQTTRTRTITPPPYPYTFTTPGNKEEPTLFPKVTFKVGPPGPICKSGCGKRCLIFCKAPCLLNCVDDNRDFIDPEDTTNPDPPDPPVINDPEPTGARQVNPPPDDPDQDDPKDEEQEEDDQLCAFEFDLPPPTFEGGDTSDGNGTSSSDGDDGSGPGNGGSSNNNGPTGSGSSGRGHQWDVTITSALALVTTTVVTRIT